jgi:hypothetical protein
MREPAKFSFTRVDASNLAALWLSLIRPGVLEVIRRAGPVPWTPEQVLFQLKAGLENRLFCEAWTISRDRPCGFVILKLYNDEFLQVPDRLFLWIMKVGDSSALKELDHFLVKRALSLGLTKISGVSRRTGFVRWARKFGFEPDMLIFTKEIELGSAG